MHLLDCDAYGDEILEYDSVTQAFEDNRIVKIEKMPDGRFSVREQCDEWFCADLTPDQLRAWGEELIEISKE